MAIFLSSYSVGLPLESTLYIVVNVSSYELEKLKSTLESNIKFSVPAAITVLAPIVSAWLKLGRYDDPAVVAATLWVSSIFTVDADVSFGLYPII